MVQTSWTSAAKIFKKENALFWIAKIEL